MAKVISIYFKNSYKDTIVDLLLNGEFDDFYYCPCQRYTTKNLQSVKEKVTGRIEYGKIEIVLEDSNALNLINTIKQTCSDMKVLITEHNVLER